MPRKYTIEEINQHLFLNMPNVQTDVGLVLGMRSFSPFVARQAAASYREGRFKLVVVSGGLKLFQVFGPAAMILGGKFGTAKRMLCGEFVRSVREADYIRAQLVQAGIPESAIIQVDRESRNTGENVQNVRGVLSEFESATVITCKPHSRRTLATIRRHIGLEKLALTSNGALPDGMHKGNWHKIPGMMGYMASEMAKTDLSNPDNYFEKGFCVPIDPDEEAKNVIDVTMSRAPL